MSRPSPKNCQSVALSVLGLFPSSRVSDGRLSISEADLSHYVTNVPLLASLLKVGSVPQPAVDIM